MTDRPAPGYTPARGEAKFPDLTLHKRGLHHVAYRCKDAQETVDFYTTILGLKFDMAFAANNVPSTGELEPHMHVFFRMDDGSCVAFFELPEAPEMGLDPNTPEWVQHLALKVDDVETLMAYKARIEGHGLEVIGPTDHGICQSIYFFDPSGHRLELSADTSTPKLNTRLAEVSGPMLEEWNRTKRAPEAANLIRGEG